MILSINLSLYHLTLGFKRHRKGLELEKKYRNPDTIETSRLHWLFQYIDAFFYLFRYKIIFCFTSSARFTLTFPKRFYPGSRLANLGIKLTATITFIVRYLLQAGFPIQTVLKLNILYNIKALLYNFAQSQL